MKRLVFIFSIFVYTHTAFGFFSDKVKSGAYAATGGAGAATGLQRLGFGQNPAVLNPFHQGIQLDYGHPYGLEALTELGAAGFRDTKNFGLAFHYWQLAWDDFYHEKTYELQTSFKLPYHFTVGVNGDIRELEILSIGKNFTWSHGQGFIWSPIDKVSLGAFMRNMWTPQKEFQPVWEMGLSLKGLGSKKTGFSPKQSLFIDWRHSENNAGQFIFGHQLQLFSCLSLHTGIVEKPFQFLFGLTLQIKNYQVQQAMLYHPDLGLSQHSGLAWDSEHY